ncbi:LuxR C-terminal-related transcriptional regulator [Streptomyces sp. CRPSP2-6A1]|uniref:LuxR C-terminal-related transcriptional regulator n=1 Tax=Streptomyces sp. CRPSP2-6A1 TaxID=2799588 RepID=UPI0027DCC1DD|nr:LuxR C-terminal-related transcriptional regulator [Streptomyces sp. CRPSP2-6A1]
MTPSFLPVARLSLREQQVLQDIAAGDSLWAIAQRLEVEYNTVASYAKRARFKLRCVKDAGAAVAVGYATGAISPPLLLEAAALSVPREQRVLLPLIARGMQAAEMASALKWPVKIVRATERALFVALDASSRPHLVTRAWERRMLTAEQVISWLR